MSFNEPLDITVNNLVGGSHFFRWYRQDLEVFGKKLDGGTKGHSDGNKEGNYAIISVW